MDNLHLTVFRDVLYLVVLFSTGQEVFIPIDQNRYELMQELGVEELPT